MFEGIVNFTQSQRGAGRGAARLLDHVGQLVGQGVAPERDFGLVCAVAEEDIVSHSEGLGVDLAADLVGLGIGVDVHRAEVVAELAADRLLHLRRQRLPAVAGLPDLLVDGFVQLALFVGQLGIAAQRIQDALDSLVAHIALCFQDILWARQVRLRHSQI